MGAQEGEEEDTRRPYVKEGTKYICSSKKEAACTKNIVCSKVGKGTLQSTFSFLLSAIVKHVC